MSLRDKILGANDIKKELIFIEEWDATIEVRTITGKQRADILALSLNPQTGQMSIEKMYPEMLIASCFDPETGMKIFEATDRDMINEKSGGAIEKLAQVALRLSGLTPAAVKEAEKNS